MLETIISDIEAAHGKQWSSYCAADGDYVVSLDRERMRFISDNFAEAMKLAAAWRRLPEYPRRPSLPPCRHEYRIKKYGSKWELHQNSLFIIGYMPTKKSVEEFIDRSEQHQRQLIEEWDATVWPQIAGKTEGVDFRYTK